MAPTFVCAVAVSLGVSALGEADEGGSTKCPADSNFGFVVIIEKVEPLT